ncbi:97d97ebd-7d06-4266-ade0-dbb2e8dd91ea [Thermothielavioides terrestris]|uniref:97d97ebd-7d06-4266-ade0-dbb2e8dd91ea n=1 Tax=Thermothielavioides terrestris TaxID=2587410 RepID=A0A3S4BR69_9PEZI|nr:97d97ebd-7d06-4266-ade0-dbb2e8dd91ea [Thermothielavioides terrestris]
MIPAADLRTWTRQVGGDTFTVSTDPSRIQLDALNAAFATDMLYWARPLPLDTLRLCVEQSLCFGLYWHVPTPGGGEGAAAAGEDARAGADHPPATAMIGLARLVTDHTTFAYLSDVYVLPAHQGRGLGRWLMQCVDEVLGSWPALRRCLLLTGTAAAARLYEETIGARDEGESESFGGWRWEG